MLTRLIRLLAPFVLFAFMTAACGEDTGPLGECPPNSESQQDLGANVIFFTCSGCHSANLTGAARQGAPVGSDYDTAEQALANAEEIYESAASGTMPPPDGLNADQIETVRIYLACGLQ